MTPADPESSPTSPGTRSTYVTQPTVPLPAGAEIRHGALAWRAVAALAAQRAGQRPSVIVVDVYPGADLDRLRTEIAAALPDHDIVDVEEAAALPIEDIDRRIAPNLSDDRVFGVLNHMTLHEFYRADALTDLGARVHRSSAPTVLVGWGAALAAPEPDALVVVDMARWELQQRQRAGAPNWRCANHDEDALRKYKRGFFVEWRIADRHKRGLLAVADFVLDGNAIGGADPDRGPAGMVEGTDFRAALAAATTRPLRVVPFFDPGVWGGQWMKEKLGLDPSARNYAWCFDCVPEENSLLLEGDAGIVEIPAMDLVLLQPRALLGARTEARFGPEFPIRFDFLDTMGGGNLSLQVHPLTGYIQDTFGMHYTQDESYYLLDASDDAVVYLGTKTGVEPDEVLKALETAAAGGPAFDADRFVNSFPARKHDHFSIPAGTVHCSGVDSMVLEISATPFIFTFKLWDWGRVGLDGIPRPVHLEHGARNIQWDRDTAWVRENLLSRPELLSDTNGVREERTGLHELEFLEVRRHWFTDEARHDTRGTVNVLNLVEGDEVELVSPTNAFAPYPIHYAETFIVPADVGEYVIRRSPRATGTRFATVKASVRDTETSFPAR